MSNGYDNSFNRNKKDLVWFYHKKMSKFYPEPYKPFGGKVNVTVDLLNYAS